MSGAVLVTGGTHGIGRACVQQLRAEGRPVAFTGRDGEAGEAVQDSTGARFVRCDATDDDAVSAAVAIAADLGDGALAGLVNNAGMSRRKAFADTTVADWDELVAVNARSAYLTTRLALEPLRRGRGSVVMVSSVAGAEGAAGLAIYAATKAALIALAQSLALELGPEIRVNAICPGQIDTRMMSAVLADRSAMEAIRAGIPAGRLGTGDDVADVVAWLLSERSGFVNGTTIVVDGGETAGVG
jgi:NAD(P)-dependent dehydrogenase (short-subunit alcohol dehydrogenase family)